MSCWPVQNCRGITSRQSPGIIEYQTCCRNSLDDEFKWNQMNTSHKRCRPSRRNEWDEWYAYNMKVIKRLSNLMKKPISEVAELLYNLTLQNYNNILNPKGKSWNSRRVPLSRLDACDRYLGVFDLEGNLRDPRHPRSLILLLEFMQSIIGSETETFTSMVPDSTANEKYKELYPFYEDKIYFMYSKRLGRLIDPDLDKIAVAIEKRNLVSNDPSHSPRSMGMTAPQHSQIGNLESDQQRQRDNGYNQIIPNRTVSFLRPVASPLDTRRSDFLLSDDKGRRRGQGSVQLDLRSKRAEFLRHLLQKVNKIDSDRFLKSLGSVDLKSPRLKRKKSKIAAEELATYYTDVVTKDPKRKKDQKQRTGQGATDDIEIARKERKYFGEPLPVLYHAPYKANDKSTWLRRYPEQLRMQEDGHVGMSSVRRYKRDSVKKSLYNAQQRYSIHSLNSVVNPLPNVTFGHEELRKKPEYKRIFQSTSRRFKSKQQSKSSLIKSK